MSPIKLIIDLSVPKGIKNKIPFELEQTIMNLPITSNNMMQNQYILMHQQNLKEKKPNKIHSPDPKFFIRLKFKNNRITIQFTRMLRRILIKAERRRTPLCKDRKWKEATNINNNSHLANKLIQFLPVLKQPL